MALMNKEELHAKAEELGVDLEGLSWPQQQSAVMHAMKGKEYVRPEPKIEEVKEEPARTKETETVVVNKTDPMDRMRDKSVLISPEMAMTTQQFFGYEEVLGDEKSVEEVQFDIGQAFADNNKDMVSATYKIGNATGKKVVATTGLPKENAGITFRPDKDLVPVVRFRGREGYLWTHHRLPNVKALLLESGYYEEYKSQFQDEPNIWHSAGKLLTCDINLVHAIVNEIERKEAARREGKLV